MRERTLWSTDSSLRFPADDDLYHRGIAGPLHYGWRLLHHCGSRCRWAKRTGPSVREMDTSSQAADIITGTTTKNLYPGDVFLIFSHVRPGENNGFTTGDIGNFAGNNNGFYISGGARFADLRNR